MAEKFDKYSYYRLIGLVVVRLYYSIKIKTFKF